MAVPINQRFFEDYVVGEVLEYGDYLITEQEIIEFARRYDPQPFHIDKRAAVDSIYGGLIASGWMTGSVMMRLMVDHFISAQASMGSPGLEQVRWIKPVRAGDRLKVRVTIVSARASQSKPDRGVIVARQEAINQQGDVVMTIEGMGMYRRRPDANTTGPAA